MIGAIIGDIVGSPYEGSHSASVDVKDFPLFSEKTSRFTDDTVLTCATADALIHATINDEFENFALKYKEWAIKYPNRGYGSAFREWIGNGGTNINTSYANGCMMRCSPIALYTQDYSYALMKARDSIRMTHNSPESERGVQSIVTAIHMALNGTTKLEIKTFIEENFGHMLDLTVEQWRQHPKTSIRCNITAPQALVCFMEGTDYESTIRNAVYTKGDTDTIAAIAGSIAEAYYGVDTIPKYMIDEMKLRITPEMVTLINDFYKYIGDTHSQYKDFSI